MGNIPTKRILTKQERRCLKDMVTGILKIGAVFVNQIAASLRDPPGSRTWPSGSLPNI